MVIGTVWHAGTFALGCGTARPDDTLLCFLARGAEIQPRRLDQPPTARAVLRLEVIAADIPFATGSFAVFPGMPEQADDTWPALGWQA